MKLLLVTIALTGLTSAQFLSTLSQCASACTDEAIKSLTNCIDTDTACICSADNRIAVEAGVPPCLDNNCTIADTQAVQDLYTKTCGNDIPGGNNCTGRPLSGQTFNSFGIPQCGVACLNQVVSEDGRCALNDFCCQCSVPEIFGVSDLLTTCILQNCTAEENNEVQAGLYPLCRAGGITLQGDPILSSASTTPPAASTRAPNDFLVDANATSTLTSTTTSTITSCTKCATHAPFSNSTSNGAEASGASGSGSGSGSGNGNGIQGNGNGNVNGANAGSPGSTPTAPTGAQSTFATTNGASGLLLTPILSTVVGMLFVGFVMMA